MSVFEKCNELDSCLELRILRYLIVCIFDFWPCDNLTTLYVLKAVFECIVRPRARRLRREKQWNVILIRVFGSVALV